MLNISKKLNINGRGGRLEFWVGTVLGFLVLLGSYFVFMYLWSVYGRIGLPVRMIFLLFNFSVLCLLVVQVRRWHDRGKGGWWVLVNLVPVVGWVWPLVECGFLPSVDENNRYG